MDFTKIFAMKDRFTGLRLAATCGCHQGKKRTNNEDNFYFDGEYMSSDNHGLSQIKFQEVSLNKDHFFCVFDGMGGGDFGEIASYSAAKATKKFLEIETNMNPCDITPSLERLCKNINEEVFEAGSKLGSSQMGSTMVGLYFHEGQVWICNLGDSPGYLLRNHKMQQMSEDHTDEAFMKENGITGRKPYLTQYLGINPQDMEIVPFIESGYLNEGDRFLICSDGVTDMISGQEICNILSEIEDPMKCVSVLIQEALDHGGKDNITAMVLDIL